MSTFFWAYHLDSREFNSIYKGVISVGAVGAFAPTFFEKSHNIHRFCIQRSTCKQTLGSWNLHSRSSSPNGNPAIIVPDEQNRLDKSYYINPIMPHKNSCIFFPWICPKNKKKISQKGAKNRISDFFWPTYLPISDYIRFLQTYLPTQSSNIICGRPLTELIFNVDKDFE